LIRRGQKDGSFSNEISEAAVSTALLGIVESLARQRVIAQRDGKRGPFSERDVQKILNQVLESFAPST
jgi:hypothetical protein